MHQVSDTYLDILQGRYRADMALMLGQEVPRKLISDEELMQNNGPQPKDGPVYREDYLSTITTSGEVFAGNMPTVGACIARTIQVSMIKPRQPIPRQCRIVPLARIANDCESSEWIPKGEFFIDTRQTEPGYEDGVEFLELTGYDAMMRAEQDYPAVTHGWPAEDKQVLEEIAEVLGVPIEPGTAETINRGFQIPNPAGYCCREVLGGIGAAYGGNLLIDDFGQLKLIPLACQTARAMPRDVGDDVDDFRFGEAWEQITCVELKQGEDGPTFRVGDPEAGRTLTAEIPWGNETVAAAILEQVGGFVHQPMTATNAVIDPAVELGDSIRVAGMQGRMLSQELDFGEVRSSTIQSPGDEEIDHEFQFSSSKDRRVARSIGGVRSAVKDAEEKHYKLVQGLKDSVAFDEDEEGNLKTALLKTSVVSAIEEEVPDPTPENPDNKKKVLTDAVLDLLAVKNEDGSYTSLAEIKATADGAQASITAKSYKDPVDGVQKSVLEMVADLLSVRAKQAELNALRTDVSGRLSVEKKLSAESGVDVYGKMACDEFECSSTKMSVGSNDMYVQTEVAFSSNSMRIGTNTYSKEEITLDYRNPGSSKRTFLVV